MSGKHYGAIQVHQEADEEVDEASTASGGSSISERLPLLLSLAVSPSRKSTASKSIAIQTDPTTLGKLQHFIHQLWSDTTFNWISPLLVTGNTNGQLNVEDLETLPLPADCETTRVYATFWKCWLDELKKAEATTATSTTETGSEASRLLLHPTAYQPSLIKALARAFGTDFLRAGLFKLIHDVNIFVGPQVLNHLIQFLRNSDAPLSRGVGLTLLVTFSQIVMSISLRHYFYKCAVLVDYKLRLR